jgi:hypothetical protein
LLSVYEQACPQIQIADLTTNSSHNASLTVTAFEPYASPSQVSPSSPFEMTESAVAESQNENPRGQTPPEKTNSTGRLARIADHS